jgi:hypothetical protein
MLFIHVSYEACSDYLALLDGIECGPTIDEEMGTLCTILKGP